ncbi:restriction endonuclease subunit S [Betaproteobacteria bacterium LSUCC0117]|nr:restriction endonuclease subunit S [Betaproteobacteria bacterium LSUCC0117]
MSEMLLEHFDLLATAPDGVARLRELILTLAVQGKLVPQNPGDEPASILLQRIRAEKDRLIAEGKIKRDKLLAPISDEEKPFELPQGWEWTSLATVGVINPRNDAADDTIASFVQMSSIPVKFTEPHQVEPRMWRDIKSGFTQFAEGDVGVAKITPCFENGKSTVFQNLSNGIGAGTTELHIVRPLGGIAPRYVLLFLKTPGFLVGGEAVMTGSAGQKRLPRAYFENKPFPLPPLAEQSRIVARAEELMRLCDALEAKGQLDAKQHTQLVQTLLGTLTDSATAEELAANWQRVTAHFDLLLDRPEAVDALEQTILQLAVRGLLVPQDSSDEPASILLQRIRAEKDRLIAEGKIKRDKLLAPISDEEKPFELPQGWEWTSLATVGVINPRNDAADDTIASFVQMSSIPVKFTEPHQVEPRMWRDIKSGFTQFAEGDVGVAKITPCFENGKSTVFQNLSNGIGAGTTELHIVRPLGGIAPRYVLLFLKTPGFLVGGEAVMTGSAGQKRLPRAYFENKPFPLPPLAEQSRIVARAEELRQLCNELRHRLNSSRTTQGHLAEALVENLAA